MERCPWCGTDPLYVRYHDEEWGVPVHDDRRHFEFLILESAQAGLSWLTILRRRENYRRAYAGFDPEAVARYGETEIGRLMADSGIIRNRRKIEASVGNARAFLAVQAQFGNFDRYIWRFVEGRPVAGRWQTVEEVPARTALADTVSADLRSRGFRFLGPVIVYAHLQATGLVNDHLETCFRREECARQSFTSTR